MARRQIRSPVMTQTRSGGLDQGKIESSREVGRCEK